MSLFFRKLNVSVYEIIIFGGISYEKWYYWICMLLDVYDYYRMYINCVYCSDINNTGEIIMHFVNNIIYIFNKAIKRAIQWI